MAWHRLDAWPDVAAGLARLKSRYWLAPVSNGNISLMIDLARRNDFPWDAILGAEFARDYKPNPRVYLGAVDAFGLEPHDCMMVAAHSSDLAAAAELGLRTAHVARPDEKGKCRGEAAPNVSVDVAAGDLKDLADKLCNTLRLRDGGRSAGRQRSAAPRAASAVRTKCRHLAQTFWHRYF